MKITICDRCGGEVKPWEPDHERPLYRMTRYKYSPVHARNDGWRRMEQMELCEACADALREFVENGRG